VGAKPPLQVPNFKQFLKNGAETKIIIEESKLPQIKMIPKIKIRQEKSMSPERRTPY
jgi:hypothetical protein